MLENETEKQQYTYFFYFFHTLYPAFCTHLNPLFNFNNCLLCIKTAINIFRSPYSILRLAVSPLLLNTGCGFFKDSVQWHGISLNFTNFQSISIEIQPRSHIKILQYCKMASYLRNMIDRYNYVTVKIISTCIHIFILLDSHKSSSLYWKQNLPGPIGRCK